MSQAKIIVIAGPTASGKSAFALALALKEASTIINADALQVYRDLPILSAQPSEDDKAKVPHELYGVLPATAQSSVGKWLKHAQAAIRKVVAEGRTPIVVGGTGLYFRALLDGLAVIPPIPADVREAVQKLFETWGPDKFKRELALLDPVSAKRLPRNDRQRLTRAYEVVTHTKKSLTEWHEVEGAALNGKDEFKIGEDKFSVERHLIMPAREDIYAWCDNRFTAMLAKGALDEVRHYLTLNVKADAPSAKTIGVRELSLFLADKISLAEATSQAQQATRNYAKRQMTWFRNQWEKGKAN